MPRKPRTPKKPEEWHYLKPPLERVKELLTFAKGKQRQECLDFMTGQCREFYVKGETAPRLRRWLDFYYRPDPATLRSRLYLSRHQDEILRSVHEAFAMVLGHPDGPIVEFWDHYSHPEYTYPPRQEDFDRRAAEWLRGVIVGKDVATLKHMIEALEMIRCELRVGIEQPEIYKSLTLPESEHTLARPILEVFREWLDVHGKLPTKGQLRIAVVERRHGIEMADSVWSDQLKRLGLRGLPRERGKC